MHAPEIRPRGWFALPIALGAVAVTWALYRVDPSESTRFPRCPLHELTGLHCPGCGSTRAAHALLHGRLATALRFNLLAVVGFPCIVLFSVWRDRRGQGRRRTAWASAAIALVVVGYGIARNIPCYPFELLAPPVAQSPSGVPSK